jgi:hypothetical protein
MGMLHEDTKHAHTQLGPMHFVSSYCTSCTEIMCAYLLYSPHKSLSLYLTLSPLLP